MFDTTPDKIRGFTRQGLYYKIHRRRQKWPSETAMISDTALNETLTATLDAWKSLPLETRLRILQSLRSFHDRCPGCDGALAVGESVVESCCRSREVIEVTCEECDAVVFEIPAAAMRSVDDVREADIGS